MEIALVHREIQQLLIKDESVTLPKVGKFAIVAKSATFLEDCTAILPPKKELLFSPMSEWCENDALEPWQHELAEKIILQLEQNIAFEVPGFGIFGHSESGEVSFEVSPEFDFAPDSFLLDSIALDLAEPTPSDTTGIKPDPAPASTPTPTPTPTEEEYKSHDVIHHQLQRQKWALWGLVALIVILVAILFIFLFRESFIEMIKNILYSKEELEIIQEWSTL